MTRNVRPAPPRVHSPPRTVEELLRLPEDEFHRHELIGGEYIVTPSPATRHQRISAGLHVVLHELIQSKGLGEVLYAPVDVELTSIDLVIPDLVVVLEANSSIVGEKRIVGPPDLVIEISSPSTARWDRVAKLDLFQRAGVREYWIVLTEENAVLQYVLPDEGWASEGCGRAFRGSIRGALAARGIDRAGDPSRSHGGPDPRVVTRISQPGSRDPDLVTRIS